MKLETEFAVQPKLQMENLLLQNKSSDLQLQPTQFKRCSFYFEDESSSFPVCVSLFEVSLTTHCLVCSLNYPDSSKRSRKPTLFFKCSAFEIDIVP